MSNLRALGTALVLLGASSCLLVEDKGMDRSTADTGPSTMPALLLVELDTNATMTAAPGQGVGVFVEYSAGGYWHIWWTCDTARTKQSCPMRVQVSSVDGVSRVVGMREGADVKLAVQTTSFVMITTTSMGIDGVDFVTGAGATITLDAEVGTLRDTFVFGVQANQATEGFTPPLMFRGATP